MSRQSVNTNKLIDIQEILFKEMKRLSEDDAINNDEFHDELARSNALYNQATGYIKTVNTNIKIMEMAKRNETRVEDMVKYLGL